MNKLISTASASPAALVAPSSMPQVIPDRGADSKALRKAWTPMLDAMELPLFVSNAITKERRELLLNPKLKRELASRDNNPVCATGHIPCLLLLKNTEYYPAGGRGRIKFVILLTTCGFTLFNIPSFGFITIIIWWSLLPYTFLLSYVSLLCW